MHTIWFAPRGITFHTEIYISFYGFSEFVKSLIVKTFDDFCCNPIIKNICSYESYEFTETYKNNKIKGYMPGHAHMTQIYNTK